MTGQNNLDFIRSLVGRRVLLKNPPKHGGVTEFKILEVCPNGEYTKMEGITGFFAGRVTWEETASVEIYEVLDDDQHPFLNSGVKASDLLKILSQK